MTPKLAIVVPCYNEVEILASSLIALQAYIEELSVAKKISADSFVLCVDDGSKDGTWNIISEYHLSAINRIKGIKLANNVGHQKALLAGLHNVQGRIDCAITIDADLQDDIRIIEHMVEAFLQGAEVVYGVRDRRISDSLFKKWTARGFYKIMNLLGAGIIENHADFRLLGPKAIECLAAFRESNLFLRGIVPLMGFTTKEVRYDRLPRAAGKTKYPLPKMLAFAWEGITSFSPAPLRLISLAGVISFIFSLIGIIYSLVRFVNGHTIIGWTSVAIVLLMLGGIQLLAMGIIGEYLAKVYIETKHRPIYFVERELM